jgi:hypothetical protein
MTDYPIHSQDENNETDGCYKKTTIPMIIPIVSAVLSEAPPPLSPF